MQTAQLSATPRHVAPENLRFRFDVINDAGAGGGGGRFGSGRVRKPSRFNYLARPDRLINVGGPARKPSGTRRGASPVIRLAGKLRVPTFLPRQLQSNPTNRPTKLPSRRRRETFTRDITPSSVWEATDAK